MCHYETLDEDFQHTTIVDWLKEAKRTSEAIWISSTSTTIPCSKRANTVEALDKITRGVPITIDKIEVHLDFHI
jgi:hypothetical protein